MAVPKETFISINREGIRYGYHVLHIPEENGMISSYIPAFDIYFSSPNKEKASERSRTMVTSFFNFWIKKQGFRSFVIQILKLGFKTQNASELKQLLERKNINAKLNSNSTAPKDYLKAEVVEEEGTLEVAM